MTDFSREGTRFFSFAFDNVDEGWKKGGEYLAGATSAAEGFKVAFFSLVPAALFTFLITQLEGLLSPTIDFKGRK